MTAGGSVANTALVSTGRVIVRPGDVPRARRQPRRHRVGVAGAAQPQLVGQQRVELGGEEAHLRRELQRLLADVQEVVRELGVQEHDRLGTEQPVLGAAEREHVRAGARPRRATARARRRRCTDAPRRRAARDHARAPAPPAPASPPACTACRARCTARSTPRAAAPRARRRSARSGSRPPRASACRRRPARSAA